MTRGKKIIGAIALGLGVASAIACGGGSSPAADGKPVTVGSAPDASSSAATQAVKKVPAAKDFKITLKTLTKECFGSYGCNITYRVNGVAVPAGLDPETTYEVSYKVTGGTEAIEGTLTIAGGKFDTSSITDELAQVKSKDSKLIATATAVEAV